MSRQKCHNQIELLLTASYEINVDRKPCMEVCVPGVNVFNKCFNKCQGHFFQTSIS